MNIYQLTPWKNKACVIILYDQIEYLKALLGENLQVGHVLQHLCIDLSGIQSLQKLEQKPTIPSVRVSVWILKESFVWNLFQVGNWLLYIYITLASTHTHHIFLKNQ